MVRWRVAGDGAIMAVCPKEHKEAITLYRGELDADRSAH